MIDARLALALDGGGLELPKSALIAVFNPPVYADLSCLSEHEIVVIEGSAPAHDHWVSRGFSCVVEPTDESYAAVVVCLPRAKSEARATIARAMTLTTGPLVIDGQKTDGADSILKDMRKRIDMAPPIAKAHGKLSWCMQTDPAAFEAWQAGPEITEDGFWSAPGVFSADGIDPASAMLAAALPEKLGAAVADLGAGWGFLSAHVLTRPAVDVVHLVEANHMSVECARRNVTDPRAVFHWADATAWVPEAKMDAVVMNPPFHTTRAADPALGQAFVRAAAAVLKPHGQLWMVCNRHLPYEDALQACFAKVTETGGDARFKLFHAAKPLRRQAR